MLERHVRSETAGLCRCIRLFVQVSQMEAAKAIGLHPCVLSRIEHGRGPMTLKVYYRYRKYLKQFYDTDPFKKLPDMTAREHVLWEMRRNNISVPELASRLGMSVSFLKNRLFPHKDSPPFDYKHAHRMIKQIVRERMKKSAEFS